ncbi:GNAT family N-acetyltransferase [Aurantivibrio plasticivorans]
MDISIDSIEDPAVIRLLKEHLADMQITSPPESRHTLTIDELKRPDVTCWVAREELSVLGCAALKELNSQNGEIKSMRTARESRGRGVAKALFSTIFAEEKMRCYQSSWLETRSTGSMPYFDQARRLYEHEGFVYCADSEDSNSCYMTKRFCAD